MAGAESLGKGEEIEHCRGRGLAFTKGQERLCWSRESCVWAGPVRRAAVGEHKYIVRKFAFIRTKH